MITVSIGQLTTYAAGASSSSYASFLGIPLWSTPLFSSPWWSTPYWSSPWASTPYGSTPYESTDPGGGGDPLKPMSLAEGVPTGWAKAPVTVTLLEAGSTDELHYVLDGVGLESYSGDIVISKEGRSSLEYWGTFLSLIEESPHNFAEVLIDMTPPVVEATQDGAAPGSITMSLSATDPMPSGVTENSGVDTDTLMYSVGGGPATLYAGPFAASIGDEIAFTVMDRAGNSSDLGAITVVGDTLAPATSAAVSPVANAAGWRSAPAIVTVTAEDAGTGVASVKYKIGSGAEVTYTGPFAVPNGTAVVTYWAVDNAGNASDPKTETVKSDSAKPVVSAGIAPTVNPEGWCQAPATVTLTAADTHSGVDVVKYRIGAGPDVVYAAPFVVPEGAVGVEFWAVDKAGNSSAVGSLDVKSDMTPPETTAGYTKKSGEWTSSPAVVTLGAADGGAGIAGTYYSIEGDAAHTYTGAFNIAARAGTVVEADLGYRSIDKLGNSESTKTATVFVDNAAPRVPSGLTYSAITTTELTLSWAASPDLGAGVAAYEIYKDNVYQVTVPGTSHEFTGLIPGSSAEYRVLALDKVGNESGLSAVATISQPTAGGTGSVPGTGSQSVEVPVPGYGTIDIQLTNVTSPGVVQVTLTEKPPRNADPEFKFMGMYFDIDFSGELGASGAFTLAMPYDPAIPDARAKKIKIKHWTNGGWETINPIQVNLVDHTITFTVTSLSPFAFAEAADVNLTTTLVAGFGAAVDTRGELTVGFGKTATLVGKLRDATGAGISGKSVIVERYDYALKTWIKVGKASAGAGAGEYRYTVKSYRDSRTPFRMRFAPDAYNTGSASANRTLMPKTSVRTPIAPKTMSRTKRYKVHGSLKPKHTASTYPVRIYKWRKTSTGKWKSYGYVKAKAYNDGAYTKYSVKLRLSKPGKWRLRAYTPKDSLHAATWSSGYDYVKVK